MAIVYAAQLVPTKLELMARWLPAQPWYAGGADRLEALGAFRFDDPDGEVGRAGPRRARRPRLARSTRCR